MFGFFSEIRTIFLFVFLQFSCLVRSWWVTVSASARDQFHLHSGWVKLVFNNISKHRAVPDGTPEMFRLPSMQEQILQQKSWLLSSLSTCWFSGTTEQIQIITSSKTVTTCMFVTFPGFCHIREGVPLGSVSMWVCGAFRMGGGLCSFRRGGWNSSPQAEKEFYSSRGLQAFDELLCQVTRTVKQSGGGVFTMRVAKAVGLLHVQRWW